VSATAVKTLSAGHELLPTLGNDLRDLSGLHTLVYELMQNADDADDATVMVFDVTDDALVVQNDGVFSDCGSPGAPRCSGVEQDGKRVRCDFHSFLKISGQAKRQKAATTGAFGIGFTSVFQITDYPELLSRGRHWVLRYDEPQAENVHVCGGCARDHHAAGTTFVLPWARDPSSEIRQGLGVGIPEGDVAKRLLNVAQESVPGAMVFLRRLRRIEVRQNGRLVSTCTREKSDEWMFIDDGSGEQTYYVLGGSFDDTAQMLRDEHPSLLGVDVREASVTIAVPTDGNELRLPLHAVLPTQETVPLGFRLSASFYPFQDRKRLKFDSERDGESEWNRAAVRGAAALVAAEPEKLVRDIGPENAWGLFRAAHDVARQIDDAPDHAFAAFWDELASRLPDHEVVWTVDERWEQPADVVLLERAWYEAVDVLGDLGLAVVHPDIASDVAVVAAEIGIEMLDLERLAAAMSDAGMTEPVAADVLPGRLATRPGLDRLLSVVNDLVAREEQSDEPVQLLDGCAVIPCHGDVVAPPDRISAEETETVALFSDLPEIVFADLERLDSVGADLRRLLWRLQVWEVVDALEVAHEEDRLEGFFAKRDVRDVLRWLANCAGELDETKRETLRSLPVFPTAAGLRPLEDLQLPGPFTKDPLGIASTVDLTGIEDLESFLGDDGLGAQTLDLDMYIRDLLVPAMREDRALEEAALDRLLDVLASNITNLDDDIVELLANLALVPTAAGRRPGRKTYFESEVVHTVLGDAAVVSMDERRLRRVKSLFELLGVTTEPRPSDIVAAVEEAVSKPKSRERVRRVRTIIEFLGPKYRFAARDRDATLERFEADFSDLLYMEWMPVAGADVWATPDETYRTEWRTACESTGRFVDLPEKTVQQPNADLLDLLGVRMRPDPELVVDHLLNCAREGIAVAKRAYEALDGADSDVVARLHDQACIIVEKTPAVRYAMPSQVVRDPGALRRYLWPLPGEFAAFNELADSLEIAHHPGAQHAIRVLCEIAASADDTPATDAVLAAVEACWRILETELHGEGESWQDEDSDESTDPTDLEYDIEQELADGRVWADRGRVLRRPAELYIDDRPALRRLMPDAALQLLVDRPRFGTSALAVAGLQSLSAALVQDIVRVPNSYENSEIGALLRDREDALARIVSAATGTTDVLADLRRLEILNADEIVVRRQLVGDDVFDLGEHPVPAHFDKDAHRLFVQRHDPFPWTEVAVELALVLCGDDSSSFGAGAAIEKVLTADTATAAHAALDLFQIPRLTMDISFQETEEEAPEALFEDEASSEDEEQAGEAVDGMHEEDVEAADSEAPPVFDEPGDADENAPSDGPDATSVDDLDVSATPVEDAGAADEGVQQPTAGRGAQGGRTGGAAGGGRGAVGGNGASAAIRNGGERERGQPRDLETPWRVWVSGRQGEQQQERSQSEATTELRAEVSRRGVERVLQYEADHGRSAKEMAANNPGFDVESRPAPGRPPARLIEVKSLAGSWEAEWGNAGNPPQMTSEQFRLSTEDGKHWLYVVEHALDDDAWAVYPIQAIGRRANRYLLDHGWKEAADRPSGPGLIEEAYELPEPSVPTLDGVIFGREEREVGDVPFVAWNEMFRALDPSLPESSETWFTSPTEVEVGDFAVQQLEAAMGPTLPLGAVAVFRRVNGSVPDGAVVIAQIGDNGELKHVIRRAYVVRDEQGTVEGLHLRVDVPGRGDEYEFHDEGATTRIVAALVDFQAV
jgi:hypothetical protein